MLATKAVACVCLAIASLTPQDINQSPRTTPTAQTLVPAQLRGVPSDISAMWASYPR